MDNNLPVLMDFLRNILNGDNVNLSTLVNDASDLIDTLGTVETAWNTLKGILSISDRLFLRKFLRFIKGVEQIDADERKEFMNKIERMEEEKLCSFILNVIDNLEEEGKVDYFVSLFKAMIELKISIPEFKRMTLLVNRTIEEDIQFMINNINDKAVYLKTATLENLMLNGWLILISVGNQPVWAKDNSANFYQYSHLAFKFCDVVKEYS